MTADQIKARIRRAMAEEQAELAAYWRQLEARWKAGERVEAQREGTSAAAHKAAQGVRLPHRGRRPASGSSRTPLEAALVALLGDAAGGDI